MTETGASVSGFWDPLFLMKLEVGPDIAAWLRRDPFQISQRHEGFLAFQAMAPRHVPGRRTANLEQSTPWAIGRDPELESFRDPARRPRGGARPPLSRERRASFAAHQRPAEGVRLAPGPTGTSVGVLGPGDAATLPRREARLGLPQVPLRVGPQLRLRDLPGLSKQ